MKWLPTTAGSGDMVRVRLGSIYHYGVFVSEKEVIQFGLPPTGSFGAWDEVKVLTTDAETFCAGSIMEVAKLSFSEKRKRIKRKKTVEIARSRIGEGGYNLLHNNCEHFANECVFGVKYSSQEQEARERWARRPVLDVYFMRIPEGGEIGHVANPCREREISEAKNEKVKREKYYSWQLLARALEKSAELHIDDVKFEKQKNGQWRAEGFYISISHSGGFVACAYSNEPCGVDIETLESFEKHEKNREGIYDRIALDCEREPEVTSESVLTLWTKKESAFKVLGAKSFAPKKINTTEFFTDTAVFNGSIFLTAASKKNEAKFFRYYFVDDEIHQILKSEIKDTVI